MRFFEQQDEARRRTGLLIGLFVLALLGMIGSLYAALALAMSYYGGHAGSDWLGAIAGCVLVLVLLGTGLKSLQLHGGGAVVARQLGGRLLAPGAREPGERRVLNVVEEMAIASGTPVPAVYLLDRDEGINAFAAGWTPDDAAIGLTRGALRKLTRDQLQGVVAHEFSHILSGDMRLNIRLMGVLHGIVMLSEAGAVVMRMGMGSRSRWRRNRSGVVPAVVAGAVIWLVGSIGLLLGQVIKAAVSRQREFLADAAAVQFTRNPSGLAGALLKVGAPSVGSALTSARATEVSHLLFAEGLTGWARAWTATHPPLRERVRRLMPGFEGSFPSHVPDVDLALPEEALGLAAGGAPGGAANVSARDSALAQAGEPTAAHLVYAQALLGALPASLRTASLTGDGAEAVILCLLLGPEPAMRRQRLEHVFRHDAGPLQQRVRALEPAAVDLDVRARLPLLDLCLPALRGLPKPRRDALLTRVAELVHMDGRVEVFEWSLSRVLRRHLYAQDRPLRAGRRAGLAGSAQLLLSFVAHQGARGVAAASRAFAAGAIEAGLPFREPLSALECPLAAVDRALDVVAGSVPRQREAVLRGLATCVSHDGRVTAREAEVFRAVAEVLGCPVPPLLPGQPLV